LEIDMAYSLVWLPEVLRNAGLKVAEAEGWTTRGRSEMGHVRGVMLHHTATSASAVGNMPTLSVLKNGRSDLPGPLCQIGLGKDGTCYIVAAGRANHAGAGVWRGVQTGNSSFIGIEAENPGDPEANWPAVQMDAYVRLVAALLRRLGASPTMCCAHREYALPRGRKSDPRFDMDRFRTKVEEVMRGVAQVRPQIAAVNEAGLPTLRRGSSGAYVAHVQDVVGASVDGRFGPGTEAKVRSFQRACQASGNDIVPDGIVGPKTWPEILQRKPLAVAAGVAAE
jgi:hypothetical protein